MIGMNEDDLKKIEEKDLPLRYRLILKVPGTDFLENAGGIFWGIVIPVFLIMEIFLTLYFLAAFNFPVNVILIISIPVVTLMLFIKISIKRAINWWNANFGSPGFEWNIEKTLEEYAKMLRNVKKETENN